MDDKISSWKYGLKVLAGHILMAGHLGTIQVNSSKILSNLKLNMQPKSTHKKNISKYFKKKPFGLVMLDMPIMKKKSYI